MKLGKGLKGEATQQRQVIIKIFYDSIFSLKSNCSQALAAICDALILSQKSFIIEGKEKGSTFKDTSLQVLENVFDKQPFSNLTLSLLMVTQKAFVDSVDQDQTAQNVQSDL